MIGFLSASTLAQGRGDVIEIGQATTTTTLAPIYTPHDYSVTQQLYTADEIGTDGTITSIAFHWAYNGSKTYGIDVYMKHTDLTYFETTNDRIPLSAADKVFTGTINPSNDGWVTITLDTPFEYDGTNSLVIAVDRNSGSPGFSDLDNNWNVIGTWYYTPTDRYTILYNGGSTDVDPNPSYMTPSVNRPNIQIEISSSTTSCKAPKNFEASNVTNNSATLTWTAGSEEQSNWDVYLTQNSTDVPDENTTPTYQVTACTKALTGLTAQTKYYAYVRAACSSTDKSRWVSTNFTTTSEAYHVSANNAYATDFESSCDWVFTNGDLTNQWCWGNATSNGGQKAMYISNDNGASNAYTNNKAVVVYASKLFIFDQGTYTIAFDWKANGESTYDFLRVALISGDAELTASTSTPSGFSATALPTGWIAVDGGGKLNQQSSWQTLTAEITVSGTYTMVFVWRDDTSTGSNPPAAIDNISISMLSCSKPTNLTANANSIGSRTATLTWTAGGSETLWDIYLSTASTTPNAQTTPTESNIGSTSHSFNNLQPATTYYAWVRSNCGGGDVSSWSEVYSFSTTCEAYAIPQFFGFEDEASMSCFTKRSCANNTGRYNQNANTGSYCFRFFYNTNPPQYLIFPELTGTESGVHVEFYYKKHTSGTEKFKVGYSTTDDATASFTWGEEITNATTTYQLFSADYPAGTKFVGIQYTANDQYYLYIDDISLSEPPACPRPANFVASNIAGTTATLSWTETGTATNWVLQYGTDADFGTYTEKTSGFSANGNTVSIGISGLTGETQYYARVKSVVGNDESEWATCGFNTLPTCLAPTGLSATATGSTITLSWTAGATDQDAWDIRYKSNLDNDYTYIHLDNHSATSYTIDRLLPVTTYSVNVRAYCSAEDQSKWGYSAYNQNSDLSVTTDCAALTIPYFCDFEGALETSQSSTYPMPKCWTRKEYRGGYSGSYTYYPSVREASYSYPYAHGGNGVSATSGKSLHFYKPYTATDEAAIFPMIDESYPIEELQITFWARLQAYETNKDLTIGVMTDPADISTFTEVATVTVKDETFQEYTAFFEDYDGEGHYIAIRFNSSATSYIFVDDVLIDEAPRCRIPKDLEAATIAVDQATLTWTAGNDETAWYVQYKKASDSEWSMPIAVTETSYTLTGLKRATEYEARVQANCNAENQSDWTSAISFTTECGIWPIDAENALFENFDDDSYSFPPICWTAQPSYNGWGVNFNNAMVNDQPEPHGAAYSGTMSSGLVFLILPPMHIDGNATLSFDQLFGASGEATESSIAVTTLTGTFDEFTPTIWTADVNNLPSTRTNVSVSLAAYNGQDIQVAFKYDGNSTSSRTWYIDNVRVLVGSCQTVSLTSGWSWWSTNLNTSLSQLKDAIADALGTSGNATIKSQQHTILYKNGRWIGNDISTLDVKQMYEIRVSSACEFTLTGTPVNPAAEEITIKKGANWIGFTPSTSMTITHAFQGLNPVNGDVVKSKDHSAVFKNGAWVGNALKTLEPGQGYIYSSRAEGDKTFTFPSN